MWMPWGGRAPLSPARATGRRGCDGREKQGAARRRVGAGAQARRHCGRPDAGDARDDAVVVEPKCAALGARCVLAARASSRKPTGLREARCGRLRRTEPRAASKALGAGRFVNALALAPACRLNVTIPWCRIVPINLPQQHVCGVYGVAQDWNVLPPFARAYLPATNMPSQRLTLDSDTQRP